MIKLSENLLINADVQKVWTFLTDIEKSLSFNRFHVEIQLPVPFSVNSNSKFVIIHNFGFGDVKMVGIVLESIALNRIVITEKPYPETSIGFTHEIKFELIQQGENTLLKYSVSGTYGGRVQNISFKPILKGVIKEEINKIKNAIESSQNIPKDVKIGRISP